MQIVYGAKQVGNIHIFIISLRFNNNDNNNNSNNNNNNNIVI